MELELQQYRLILESSPNMVWRAGLDAKCDYFNKTWLDFTGRTAEQELGDGWAQGVHTDDLERCVKTYMDAFEKQEPFEMEYRLKRHDGVYRIINDRGVPFYLKDGGFAGYIGSCMDVTEKIEGEMFREMAIKDGLTGIYNRQFFIKQLEKEIELSKINNRPLVLIMLDVDNFKKINDKYGHLSGDLTLKKVTEVLRRSTREEDIIGRFGGDEFIIILPKSTPQYARNIAERIRGNIEAAEIKTDEKTIKVTVSVGITGFLIEQNKEDLIEKADKAMYRSKIKGGNLVSQ